MFSIVYFTMRPLSTVDDNLKRDEKLNNLISSLKCKGPAFRLESINFTHLQTKTLEEMCTSKISTRRYGPDSPILKLVITDH